MDDAEKAEDFIEQDDKNSKNKNIYGKGRKAIRTSTSHNSSGCTHFSWPTIQRLDMLYLQY
jgi:hypothetical protein